MLPGSAPQAASSSESEAVSAASSVVMYCCPECGRLCSNWDRFVAHLRDVGHTLTACADCGLVFPPPREKTATMIPEIEEHQRTTGHFTLTRPVRLEPDYRIASSASPNPAALKQYACDCSRVFLGPLQLLTHLASIPLSDALHTRRLGPQQLRIAESLHQRSSSSASSALGVVDAREGLAPEELLTFALVIFPQAPSPLRDVPQEKRDDYVVAYQCPECSFLFPSWARMEKHLTSTRHSLAYCAECRTYLGARGHLQSKSHHDITGHVETIGEHRTKKDYEVSACMKDPAILALVDIPLDTVDSMTRNERNMFQCPYPKCCDVFRHFYQLEEHFYQTGHDLMHCETCNSVVKIVTPPSGLFSHEHNITLDDDDSVVPKVVMQRGDDFRVIVSNKTLLDHFGNRFFECKQCHTAIEAELLAQHTGSVECEQWLARNQEMRRQ